MRFMTLASGIVLMLLLSGCALPATVAPARVQPTLVSAQAIAAPTQDAAPAAATAVPREAAAGVPTSCHVTQPQQPAFVPPAPFTASAPWPNQFWYGTEALWTAMPSDGRWYGLPHNPEGYTQKVFWWRKGYSWTSEPQPDLIVTGRRLDAAAPPAHVSRATNAYASDIQSAMLVGMDFPTLGCWEITGHYAGATLRVVVWIAP